MAEDMVLRATPDRGRADEWALALNALAIDARIDWVPQHGFVVVVGADDAPRALVTLTAYDRDTAPRPQRPLVPEYGPSLTALIAAAVLCVIFVFSGPRDGDHFWFAAGSADATRIAAGEWWRNVTALLLHADFLHVLSNAIVLVLFGGALCRLIGPGAGLALMVLAGGGGNALNIALRGAPHNAIGASTGIFGAIGGLAAVRVVQHWQGARVSAWRAWAPLAAGIALLGMLGSSTRSDVLAHLFGFAVGVGLGGLLTWAHPQPLRRGVQWGLVAAMLALVVGCVVAAGVAHRPAAAQGGRHSPTQSSAVLVDRSLARRPARSRATTMLRSPTLLPSANCGHKPTISCRLRSLQARAMPLRVL
ncbi:MAG: rhomboid family intramembrane serine protease [bacterium]